MINVDTVYQTVQALANKEQRGYLTPQEFNLFANQVQQDIFEQYFYDLNTLREARPESHLLGDSVTSIMEKIRATSVNYGITTINNGTNLPNGRIGRIFLNQGGDRRTLRLIDPDDIRNLFLSKWHKKGLEQKHLGYKYGDAFYFDDGDKKIQVWDGSGQINNTGTDVVTCERIRGIPGLVSWGYIVVNEKPLYDPTSSRNFELHASEQSDVVIKILKLAGISIEDSSLYQAATAEEQQNLQQENK